MNRLKKTLATLALGASLATQYVIQATKTGYAAQQPTQAVMDLQAAQEADVMPQEYWIDFFNGQGKAMISAPDLYLVGQKGPRELLTSIRENFRDLSTIITSTGIIYDANDLGARIIQNYGSKVVKPTERKVVVPSYEIGTKLSKVLQTAEGLAYLTTLFNTEDSAETIGETLRNIGWVMNIDEIYLATPTQGERKSIPGRIVSIVGGAGNLIIKGEDPVDANAGQSRGISFK